MRRLAIYAHYDERSEIKRYVLKYLEALRGVAERVVFVSTARLGDTELEKVAGLVDQIHQRENVGYDFAMWSDALSREDVAAWDEVVLTNSSVFGPITPLSALFGRMEAVPCDYWGLTESREIDRHLQSYFLVFRAAALAHPAFARFWRSVEPLRDKRDVIRRYEIGLSRALRQAGLEGRAFVPPSALPWRPVWKALLGTPRNPSLLYAIELLDAGMPFLKIEVLRDNPGRVSLAAVHARLRRAGYDPTLLEYSPRG